MALQINGLLRSASLFYGRKKKNENENGREYK